MCIQTILTEHIDPSSCHRCDLESVGAVISNCAKSTDQFRDGISDPSIKAHDLVRERGMVKRDEQ